MSELQLFSTSGCHLCEIAEALLQQHRQRDGSITWTVVDIADDDKLFERYGWLIPVLAIVGEYGEGSEGDEARPDNVVQDSAGVARELRWPFDEHSLAEFLQAYHR